MASLWDEMGKRKTLHTKGRLSSGNDTLLVTEAAGSVLQVKRTAIMQLTLFIISCMIYSH